MDQCGYRFHRSCLELPFLPSSLHYYFGTLGLAFPAFISSLLPARSCISQVDPFNPLLPLRRSFICLGFSGCTLLWQAGSFGRGCFHLGLVLVRKGIHFGSCPLSQVWLRVSCVVAALTLLCHFRLSSLHFCFCSFQVFVLYLVLAVDGLGRFHFTAFHNSLSLFTPSSVGNTLRLVSFAFESTVFTIQA